jgi:hypothetical protein
LGLTSFLQKACENGTLLWNQNVALQALVCSHTFPVMSSLVECFDASHLKKETN